MHYGRKNVIFRAKELSTSINNSTTEATVAIGKEIIELYNYYQNHACCILFVHLRLSYTSLVALPFHRSPSFSSVLLSPIKNNSSIAS